MSRGDAPPCATLTRAPYAAQDGSTPLHLASLEGHTEVAKLLIKKGAPLDAKDKVRARRGPHAPPCATLTRAPYAAQDGDTPLHLASKNGHTDVAKLLIEKGAEVDATNKVRARPARRGPHAPPFATLTRAPYAAQMGCTSLHLASKKRVARLLIDKGAPLDAKNFRVVRARPAYRGPHAPPCATPQSRAALDPLDKSGEGGLSKRLAPRYTRPTSRARAKAWLTSA